MVKLREQMQADLQLRGITPRTQATYLREVETGTVKIMETSGMAF
jgi:hypothetical protein